MSEAFELRQMIERASQLPPNVPPSVVWLVDPGTRLVRISVRHRMDIVDTVLDLPFVVMKQIGLEVGAHEVAIERGGKPPLQPVRG